AKTAVQAEQAGAAATAAAPTAGGELLAVFGGIAAAGAGVVAALQGIAGAVAPFVQALAPGTMQILNLAMRDLQATIGTALLPIVTVATDAFRQMADVLLPVMEELQPVIASLAEAIAGALVPIVEVVAAQLRLWMPVFSAIASVAKELSVVFRVWSAVVQGFVAGLKATLGALAEALGIGSMKDVFADLQSAFRKMVEVVILSVAALGKLLGFGNFVKGFVEGLKGGPRKSAAGLAAPVNATIKDFSTIGKDLAIAAQLAGAGGGKKETTDDWIKKIGEKIEWLDAKQLIALVEKKLDEVTNKVLTRMGEKFKVELVKQLASAARKSGGLAAISPALAIAAAMMGGEGE